MDDSLKGIPEVLRDADLLGDKAEVSHEDAVHFGELTEEEKAVAKKLVLKIDLLIMPLVVLVYLMNYIDRYVDIVTIAAIHNLLTNLPQKQLCCC